MTTPAPGPVRQTSPISIPLQANADEVKTIALTSEEFAIPDTIPKFNDWLKVAIYVIIFSIVGINIWGIVDTTTFKYKPMSTNRTNQHDEETMPINVVNIFSLVTGSAGIVLAILMLVATVMESAKLFKLAYQALLMLLGAHTVVFMAVVIWYAVHHVKLEGPCKSEACAAVRITTVAWSSTNIALFITAAVLSRWAVYKIDPVLHVLGRS